MSEGREPIEVVPEGLRQVCAACRRPITDLRREDVLTASGGDAQDTAAVALLLATHPGCRAEALLIRTEALDAVLAVLARHWAKP